MAIFQAKNIAPSSFAGVGGGTVDILEGLTINWQVNGTNPLNAYRIVIYENDNNSTMMYDTDVISLPEPFFGTRFDGAMQPFVAIIEPDVLQSAGLVNGTDYKYDIMQYWVNGTSTITRQYFTRGSITDVSIEDEAFVFVTPDKGAYRFLFSKEKWLLYDSVVDLNEYGITITGEPEDGDMIEVLYGFSKISQSSLTFITTRRSPTLAIDAFPTPLNVRSYVFTATYQQEQGDSISFVRWYIYDINTGATIKDTGNIYGTSQLKVDYDGFFANSNYGIRCTVQTGNGVDADTGVKPFNVSYGLEETDGKITACRMTDRACVGVSWTQIHYIMGNAEGNYKIKDEQLQITEPTRVSWDNANDQPMLFMPEYAIFWCGYVWKQGATVFEITTYAGVLLLTLQPGSATLKLNENVIGYIDTETNLLLGRWTAIITPGMFYLQKVYGYGGLYPSGSLFPSTSLYPKSDILTEIDAWQSPLALWESPIIDISILPTQICDYLWIRSATNIDDIISTVMGNLIYNPEWDSETKFLASFKDGLNAGNLSTIGYAIYRKEGDVPELIKIADFGLTDMSFVDYSARSNTPYTYYLFHKGEMTFSSLPFTSNTLKPIFENWTIIECKVDDNGNYRVIKEYTFAINVESGPMSNNNVPEVIPNFTRYPTRQAMTANYKSGTLGAFIGSVDMNYQYVDGVSLADEIYALSTSINPKFLKDRKGNLLQIETSAAIAMKTMDATREQPYIASIPWVEVNTAHNKIIINTPSDTRWPDDMIVRDRVYYDFSSGTAKWVKNDGGFRSELAITSNKLITQTDNPWCKMLPLILTEDKYLIADESGVANATI